MNERWSAVVLGVALGALALGGVDAPAAAKAVVSISNGELSVEYDTQTASFSARRGTKKFIERGTFGDFLPDAAAKVRTLQVGGSLGAGKALELAHGCGRTATLVLYDKLPLICVKTSIHNPSSKPVTIDKFTPLAAHIDLGTRVRDLRVLGYDGLAPADGPKTTYTTISVADPKTRSGVVCAWITHDRASGIVTCKPEGDHVRIEGRSEYGRLLVPAGETAAGETVAIGYFEDVLDGLELSADAVAKHYGIKLKPVPSGYMTWYHARALDEKRMPVLANWCAENLQKYGFDFLQIDDGWQLSRRDFTWYNPKGVYPGGMKRTAEAINKNGLVAGIWVTPFGWDHTRAVLADHQDWFVKRKDGSVYAVKWGGDCLDMSHPQAREFLHGVIHRIADEWGYKFFKLDALWAGVAAKLLYSNPKYRPDNFGDAVFHDPGVTNIEAFRKGLKVVRDAAGDDTYLLGCTVSQNMRTLGGSIGLVDGIRVGVDSGRKWSGILANVRAATAVYYLHGRVWHNDADVLYLDKHFTLDQVRCWASWLAISGNMYMVSNWLPDAPAQRIDVIKRTIPNHNRRSRPVDLYEAFHPRVWHLRDGQGESRRDVVGLFNWDDQQRKISVPLARLGLSRARYAIFDFWEDKLERLSNLSSLEMTLRPKSCRVISLKLMDHPVVVSTSRHVTQGIFDLVEEKWDKSATTLSGASRVVGGDPYEIRTAAPDVVGPWQAYAVKVSDADRQAGVTVEIAAGKKSPNARVVIKSPVNREVAWTIWYTRGKSIYRANNIRRSDHPKPSPKR